MHRAGVRGDQQRSPSVLLQQTRCFLGRPITDGIQQEARHVLQFGIDRQNLPQQGIVRVASFYSRNKTARHEQSKPLGGAMRRSAKLVGQAQFVAQCVRIANRGRQQPRPFFLVDFT
jgi:hypothetical protein